MLGLLNGAGTIPGLGDPVRLGGIPAEDPLVVPVPVKGLHLENEATPLAEGSEEHREAAGTEEARVPNDRLNGLPRNGRGHL